MKRGADMVYSRLAGLCVAVFLILFPLPVKAAEHTLVISSWADPDHSMNSRMWPAFIQKIEEATKGRLTAKVVYQLGAPSEQLSLIEKGEADIGWVFHGYQPQRFVSASLLLLPGYEAGPKALSAVYWRAYQKYFKTTGEYHSVKLLGLMVDGAAQLHSSRPIATLNDMTDLRLRISGDLSYYLANALGAMSVHVPANHIHETLAEKTIDGLFLSFEGRRDFSFNRTLPHVFEVSGGFSRNSYALVMNRRSFYSLPADIREILDTEVFGEPLSQMAGGIWEQADAIGRAAMRTSDQSRFIEATPDDLQRFKMIINQQQTQAIENAAKAGINARAAFDFITAEAQAPGKEK